MAVYAVLNNVIDMVVFTYASSSRVKFSPDAKKYDGTSSETAYICDAITKIANGIDVIPPESPSKKCRLLKEVNTTLWFIMEADYAVIPRCGSRDLCVAINTLGAKPLFDFMMKYNQGEQMLPLCPW